jgi:hypothetical protein
MDQLINIISREPIKTIAGLVGVLIFVVVISGFSVDIGGAQ